jgi:CHRD domain
MKRLTILTALIVTIAGTAYAFTDGGSLRFSEFLTGLKEAPAIVSTTGTGTFRAEINRDGTAIDYVLTFKNLQSDVRQAHIHIGHPQNAGSIVLWLCDSAAAPLPVSPVASTPLCVQNDPMDLRNGTVTGTLTEADVMTLAGNGIAGPADFAEVVALVRAGKTYVNVHTADIGAGEIRSQIDNGDDNRQDHDHQNH